MAKAACAETTIAGANLSVPICSNYRTWICMAFYGFSFGVELTVDNNLAPYIQSQFNKSILAAGNYAAIFGLLNFFSRPGGARHRSLCTAPRSCTAVDCTVLHTPHWWSACLGSWISSRL